MWGRWLLHSHLVDGDPPHPCEGEVDGGKVVGCGALLPTPSGDSFRMRMSCDGAKSSRATKECAATINLEPKTLVSSMSSTHQG